MAAGIGVGFIVSGKALPAQLEHDGLVVAGVDGDRDGEKSAGVAYPAPGAGLTSVPTAVPPPQEVTVAGLEATGCQFETTVAPPLENAFTGHPPLQAGCATAVVAGHCPQAVTG